MDASTRASDPLPPTSLTCLTCLTPGNAPLPGTTSNPVQITVAMTLLHAGVDTAVIALWLGHADLRSTNAYLHADMTIKQRALDRTAPPGCPTGRYHPPDPLIAFLEAL